MACCDDPQPAILEKNGRLFCRNCHRYLSDPPPDREPLPETPPAIEEPPDIEDETPEQLAGYDPRG